MDRSIAFEQQQFSLLEAANHLRISRSFLYKLISAGSIRPTKIGSRVIFSGAEIARFLREAEAPKPPKTRRAA